MPNSYRIPSNTRIGHIHLKVANIPRALSFYSDILGYEITTTYGDRAVFLSAGGYHHHIALNTWQSLDAEPAPKSSTGLFHLAICYPEKEDLANIYLRLQQFGYPLTGASDHGVSLSLYLNDHDQNGVELYWDRPEKEWPRHADGSLNMYTRPLDVTILSTMNDR